MSLLNDSDKNTGNCLANFNIITYNAHGFNVGSNFLHELCHRSDTYSKNLWLETGVLDSSSP